LGPRGCSSMVELKPSKLMTRVRFPSPAPVAVLVEKFGVAVRMAGLVRAVNKPF
jgi:hypothetical protein